jgi:hypothetical protein
MRAFATWLLALTVLVAPATAFAQSEADKSTARQLAIDAQAALEAGDAEKAADLFRRADELYHAPTLVLGLARAYAAQGKYVEATEAYNRLIREALAADASDKFKQAQADAQSEIGGVQAKIAWVTITVEGPPQPTLDLDGVAMSAAALGVRRAVNPGEHTLRASGEGFAPGETKFSVGPGESTDVALKLEPGESGHPLPPGETASGDDPGMPMRIAGFVALGLGGAALILGGVTGGLAMGKHGDLEEACPEGRCPADQQSNLDSFHTLGTVSTVGFVVGGVLAAGGLVLVLVAPSGGQEEAALELGPSSASLRVRF